MAQVAIFPARPALLLPQAINRRASTAGAYHVQLGQDVGVDMLLHQLPQPLTNLIAVLGAQHVQGRSFGHGCRQPVLGVAGEGAGRID